MRSCLPPHPPAPNSACTRGPAHEIPVRVLRIHLRHGGALFEGPRVAVLLPLLPEASSYIISPPVLLLRFSTRAYLTLLPAASRPPRPP
eukprot:7562136-Pyramimonas_sp.AAC.1